ncbi:MAG: ATP-binding protein [Nitrospirae bacterium]|nr:ATP-binding protein [Nitrospirota bacterium]MCL5977289.1 ATP-binding protein [Nitrospirota bacterium]
MEDLSLHMLDIAENSIDADATKVEIKVVVNEADDRFTLIITDNGKGIDAETLKMVKDPFFSTKTVRKKKFGLGIPLLAQAAEECNGAFRIESHQDRGTVITAVFQNSHIDRKPLGDIGATMAVLIGGHPDMDFLLSYERNGLSYKLNTVELKKELQDVPINLPDVLKLIKEDINSALKGEL